MNQSEKVRIYFQVFDDSTGRRVPLPGVRVLLKDSASHEQIAFSARSDESGVVQVELSGTSLAAFYQKVNGTRSGGIDLFFSSVAHEKSEASRPVRVINRLGLYCEGRDAQDLLRLKKMKPEIRFLRKVVEPLSQDEISRFGRNREEELRVLLQPEHRIILLTGKPGSGLTSIIRQATHGGFIQRQDTFDIYCVSFELDSSSRAFAESFAMWLATALDQKIEYPLSIDKMRELLAVAEPMTIVFDGIDELSDSGIDRGYGAAVRKLISDLVNGRNGLQKHGAVLTSRSVPEFLRSNDSRIHRLSINADHTVVAIDSQLRST